MHKIPGRQIFNRNGGTTAPKGGRFGMGRSTVAFAGRWNDSGMGISAIHEIAFTSGRLFKLFVA
jgi:hypothetical protein